MDFFIFKLFKIIYKNTKFWIFFSFKNDDIDLIDDLQRVHFLN